MEIYKDLSNPASKEFEQLLNSQFTKTANLEEGKIITGVVNKVTDNFVFLEVPGLKSEPILDINELKSMGMLFNSLMSKIGSDFKPGTSRNTKLSVTLFTTPVIIFPSSRFAVFVNWEFNSCSNSFEAAVSRLLYISIKS